MRSDLYPSPASIRYGSPPPPPPVAPPPPPPVVMGRQLAPPPLKPKRKPQPPPVVQGDWWPCFVCGLDVICQHRETDIVTWMAARA